MVKNAQLVKDPEEIKGILVATKCDLEINRQVEYSEGREIADSFGIPYIETSAKEGTNATESLIEAIRFTRGAVIPRRIK